MYNLCMCFDFYFHFKFSLHKWLHFVHTFVISLLHGVLSTYYIYVDYIEVAQCIIYYCIMVYNLVILLYIGLGLLNYCFTTYLVSYVVVYSVPC